MKTTNQNNVKRPRITTNSSGNTLSINAGLYTGIVVNDVDERNQNKVKVNISKFNGMIDSSKTDLNDDEAFLGAFWCRYGRSHGGTTPPDDIVDGAQVTYGDWSQSPAIGTEVLVGFPDNGTSPVILAILTPEGKNTSIPSMVTATTDVGEAPSEDLSKKRVKTDKKPAHPLFDALKTQGLDKDKSRGLTTSGGSRESPSKVYGFKTKEGHHIVMDDGAEDGSDSGIRIRCKGGAQIFLNDVTGSIYAINAGGTSWVELTKSGRLDIFAEGAISMHSKDDINLHATKDINLHAQNGGLTLFSGGSAGIKMYAGSGDLDLLAATNFKLTADAGGNIFAGSGMRISASRIDLNGPKAVKAAAPKPKSQPNNTDVPNSMASIVPEHEPWKGHDD